MRSMPSQAKGEHLFSLFFFVMSLLPMPLLPGNRSELRMSPSITVNFINILLNIHPIKYRGDVSSGVSDRVLSQLLTELDGVHVSLKHTLSTLALQLFLNACCMVMLSFSAFSSRV